MEDAPLAAALPPGAACKAHPGALVSPWDPSAPPQLFSFAIPCRSESAESPDAAPPGVQAGEQPAVIPAQGDLLGDLLNLDLGPPVSGPPIATSAVQMGAVDLLGGGLDSLVRHSPPPALSQHPARDGGGSSFPPHWCSRRDAAPRLPCPHPMAAVGPVLPGREVCGCPHCAVLRR